MGNSASSAKSPFINLLKIIVLSPSLITQYTQAVNFLLGFKLSHFILKKNLDLKIANNSCLKLIG